MAILFKTDNEREEWLVLATSGNRTLAKLLLWLADYCSLEFNKDLTITELYRTPEETQALYAATPPELRPSWKPHENWLAADLRSSVFTQPEIEKLLHVANMVTAFKGQRKTAIYHTIRGNTSHFHVQIEDRSNWAPNSEDVHG